MILVGTWATSLYGGELILHLFFFFKKSSYLVLLGLTHIYAYLYVYF